MGTLTPNALHSIDHFSKNTHLGFRMKRSLCDWRKLESPLLIMESEGSKAVIIGSTGAIGKELIRLL